MFVCQHAPMKKTISVLCIFALLGIGSHFLLKGVNRDKPTKLTQRSKSRIPLKQVKYIKQESSVEQKTTKTKILPDECDAFLQTVSYLTQNELFDLIQTGNFELNLGCKQKLTQMSPSLINPDCDFTPQLNKESQAKCLASLSILKAIYITDQVSAVSLRNLTDSELAAFATKAFFTINEKMKVEDYKKNLEYFKEFHERFPEDSRVIEAYVGYMLIGTKITGAQDSQTDIKNILAEQEGKNFNIDRLQVIQYAINDDFERARDAVQNLEKIYPQEADLEYYKAAYFWKMKDKTQTLYYLDLALSKAQNCALCTPGLYKDTKEKLKSAHLGQTELFSVSFSLNFEDF